MKMKAGIAAIVAVLGMAQIAAADFDLSYRVQPDAPDANHWRIQFFARNDGNHGSGIRLLDEEIELVSDQKMVIGSDSDGGPDVSGYGAADFFNSDRSFINILGNYGDPENHIRGWIVWTNPQLGNPNAWVGGSSDFRVARNHLNNHGVVADASVNNGLGALIATAVVPNTATYVKLIPWGLGGETGPAFGDFLGHGDPPPQIGTLEPGGWNQLDELAVAVPEPSMLAFASAVGLSLVRRRRTATAPL